MFRTMIATTDPRLSLGTYPCRFTSCFGTFDRQQHPTASPLNFSTLAMSFPDLSAQSAGPVGAFSP